MFLPVVTSKAFQAMQNLNIETLVTCTEVEMRPFLPSLVRMSLLPSTDPSATNRSSWPEYQKKILSILVGIETVNNIVSLLQVNFHDLEIEVKKEQQMRQKQMPQQNAVQYHSLQNGVALGFERADVTKKLRIVLSEMFFLQSQINEHFQILNSGGFSSSRSASESLKSSELFDNEIYFEEIADIICVVLAELPSLLNIQEIVETLLYVNHGHEIICWIVANMPDSFKEIITLLISTGEEETADGRLRLVALSALCDMNPRHWLSTRSLCVELCKMPSLMLKLSLEDPQDLIAFVSGLLLGNDPNTRTWFAAFVRTSQKRKSDALQNVRDELLKHLLFLANLTLNKQFTDEFVVQASALLRLYCALKGIAGIKFNDDEIHLLVQLITSRPSPTTAGIRFVSLGLCMLIACPSLIAQPASEANGIEWVQWLIKEETYFESNTGVVASFGEMLLLMAIHFHSNQVPAIGELVCATLGMKIPLRPNNTTRMKQIFTQDIFTEQVVAAHAVKVQVTPNLNANIAGYLPVHCIHQLLKSRAFSKHKVPIKNWIYMQICNSTTPLHPWMPALIEVYVSSILTPNSGGNMNKNPIDQITHKPLTEQEILKVFKKSVAGVSLEINRKNYLLDYDNLGDHHAHQDGGDDEQGGHGANITSQLLLLYYLLLYEDIRMNNMMNILASGRKIKSYSTEFLSELPIKFLLQQAQKNQQDFGGLFSPLLRLLVTHFPHLSLVDDWLEEESISRRSTRNYPITEHSVVEAFKELEYCPTKTVKLLKRMLKKSPTDLWPLTEIFIKHFKFVINPGTLRVVQELYKQVWIHLNTVLPRRLWATSIQSLLPEHNLMRNFALSHDHVMIDALHVLRCDERVFRCPDALSVVLRILQASLAASKSQLQKHIQDKPMLDKSIQAQGENEREELKVALIYAQETTAVQILLEACQENEHDYSMEGNNSWVLQEIRGIVCSYIHQVFISDITLAKLVLFQGFQRDLLTIIVRGVPSMHVCLHYLPELLNMPEIEKQIFAIDLASHLSIQYTLPKSFSIAKLCINTLSTLLGSKTISIVYKEVL